MIAPVAARAVRRTALVVLALASGLLPLLALADNGPSRWLAALLVFAFPVALMALGAGADRRALGSLLVVLALLEGTGLALVAVAGLPVERWVAGVPVRLGLLLGGLWFLPMVVAVAAYAATFERGAAGDSQRRPANAPMPGGR